MRRRRRSKRGANQGHVAFNVTRFTGAIETVTATDTANSSITGGDSVTVAPAAATRFAISAAGAITGSQVNVTVTALDAYGNTATSYTGTPQLASTDKLAVINLLSHTGPCFIYSVTFNRRGPQTLTVTDALNPLPAIQSAIAVTGAASSFVLSGLSATTTAGVAQQLNVTVKDAFGNVVQGYAGTVHLSSTDIQAGLPANYTFMAADAGTHTFTITLKTAGSRSVTVTDVAKPTITKRSPLVIVTPAAASNLLVTGPASVIHGVASTFNVTAQDAYGNTVTGYRGTMHFTSSDPLAVLPADRRFNGSRTQSFKVTFKSVGMQSVTVTDTLNSALNGQVLQVKMV